MEVRENDIKKYFTKEPLFFHNDIIHHEDIELIRKYKEGNISLLGKIFEGSKLNKTSEYPKWTVEVKCLICEKTSIEKMSKNALIEYIKKDNYKCKKCLNEEKIQSSIHTKESKKQWELDKPRRTQYFIDNYLNPMRYWKKDLSISKKYYELQNYIMGCNQEEITKQIQSMNYHDFLQTPYWKAIALKVKKDAKFKCKLCNSSNNLSVHHRTYKNHGNELFNLDDLICVCQDCHQIFHDNKEEN